MEIAAQRGRDAERAEEPVAHARARHELGAPASCSGVKPRRSKTSSESEHRVQPLPVEIVGIGEVALRKEGDALGDAHQPRGVAIGQRLHSAASTKAKMATLAPMPSASVRMAVAVNPGVWRSWRIAKRRSCSRCSRNGRCCARGRPAFVDSTPPSFRRARAARRLRRHARAEVVVDVHLEVAVELVGELALAARRCGDEAGQSRAITARRPPHDGSSDARNRARIGGRLLPVARLLSPAACGPRA